MPRVGLVDRRTSVLIGFTFSTPPLGGDDDAAGHDEGLRPCSVGPRPNPGEPPSGDAFLPGVRSENVGASVNDSGVSSRGLNAGVRNSEVNGRLS